MDTSTDHYAVLGVTDTAGRTEIKAAWSQLVQKYHPDMGDEADATKFMEVQKAFDVLGDDTKRLEYDSARNAANAGRNAEPGWGEPAPETETSPAPSTRRDEWVPPHMRPETGPDPQYEPPAPEPRAEHRPQSAPRRAPQASAAPRKHAHPKPHTSWRIEVNPDQKLTITQSWARLWLPALTLMAFALIASLQAIRAAGEGFFGSITPAVVGLLFAFGIVGVLVDWIRLQNGTDSSAGVKTVCLTGTVIAVTGFKVGNIWLLAAAVFICGTGALIVHALHYKYVVTRQMSAKQLRKYVAFGKPGKHAPTNILQIVERDLADKLNELFAIASVRLFHGLGIPATKNEQKQGGSVNTAFGAPIVTGGYLGQAVTAGDRVALLSSVVWPAGHYTVDQYGSVLIDGQHTQYEIEPFVSDFRHWKDRLRGLADVRHLVVVHSDGPVTVDMPDSPVEFVPVDKVVDTLGPWMVGEQGTADRKLNAVMSEHLAAA